MTKRGAMGRASRLLAAVAMLALATPASAQPTVVFPDRTPVPVPGEADQTAATEIEKRLSADELVNAQNVKIVVVDGVATLRGRVPDEEAKRRAEEIAGDVPGVKRVVNEISVGVGGLGDGGGPGPIPDKVPGRE
jgi:hypothetical protein